MKEKCKKANTAPESRNSLQREDDEQGIGKDGEELLKDKSREETCGQIEAFAAEKLEKREIIGGYL